MAELHFSLDQAPQDDMEILPAGEYTLTITSAIKKESKAGNEYLALAFKSELGPVVFDNLNLWHPVESVMKTAYAILSRIMQSAGIERLTDTDQLIGAEVYASVVVEEDGYGQRNRVKRFLPRPQPSTEFNFGGNKPGATGKKGGMPWER